MTVLEKELNFFMEHETELVEKYRGKFLIIQGDKVIAIYDNIQDAYFGAQDEHGLQLGTFMLRKCIPTSEEVNFAGSRAIFAH